MSDKKHAILFLSFAALFLLCSCASKTHSIKKLSRSYSNFLNGLVSDRLGHFEEAASYYRRAQDYDQTASELHLHLAFDLIKLEKYTQAAGELKKVLSSAPQQDDARYILALLYVQLNSYEKAIEQFEHLLKSRLDHRLQNIELRRILSQLYFLRGNIPQARYQCGEILKLDPLNQMGLYFLVAIDLQESDIEAAISGYQAIIENYPLDGEAKNDLAYLYSEEGINLPQALMLAETAVELDPSNGAYIDTLGWIYFKMGDFDQAILYLEKASKLTFDPEILNHLGQAYAAKNMMSEACQAWKASLRLDPTQKNIRDFLKKEEQKR
ncbi:MAG: tetratricopeptide repeat protein [Candidatus Omnitrophota bacterium]